MKLTKPGLRNNLSKVKIILPAGVVLVFLLLVTFCRPKPYFYNNGTIFGTTYQIVYENPQRKDLHEEIKLKLNECDLSFSTFKENSTISKVNTNQEVILDQWFIDCFKRSQEISELTGGTFDITVAPLVNAWGFGFKHKENITPQLIDSLLKITGYTKVRLENGRIIKENPAIMLDMSAIAKGYTCDIIAGFLESKGCKNYMVEIGGEVAAQGINAKGRPWSIGISEPNPDAIFGTQDLEAIVKLTDKSLATSGNYRNYYEENGRKFAHTINPATGYPVEHSLLSATVLAGDCMTADALATAFMVMGLEKGVELSKTLPEIEVFFVYSDENGFHQMYMSPGFGQFLTE